MARWPLVLIDGKVLSRSETQQHRRRSRRQARAAGPSEYEWWKRSVAAGAMYDRLSPSKKSKWWERRLGFPSGYFRGCFNPNSGLLDVTRVERLKELYNNSRGIAGRIEPCTSLN